MFVHSHLTVQRVRKAKLSLFSQLPTFIYLYNYSSPSLVFIRVILFNVYSRLFDVVMLKTFLLLFSVQYGYGTAEYEEHCEKRRVLQCFVSET